MLAAEVIKKKRNNIALSSDEIQNFIKLYTQGEIPDYQMSALLMAIYFNGMNQEETLALTKSMLYSGIVVDTSSLKGFKADKHSTGGVGDKTSLILGPIVAACGVYVPMISGRGLGHTGGTLDKLESIPGFNTQQNLNQFIDITQTIGTCFIGQTKEICPADKKIYALRDVTATIESLPLICASIMSKKLAEGIDGLVLDVKFGSGAFMKTQEKAEELARHLMMIGQGYGKKVVSLITSMNQPLGRFAGNALEVYECLEIMKNQTFIGADGYDLYEDTRELSLQLSAHMLLLAHPDKTFDHVYQMAKEALTSGAALKVFEKMCELQGGRLSELSFYAQKTPVYPRENGFLKTLNVEKIGIAGLYLRAGRSKTDDIIDPQTGIEFHKKIGDQISKDSPLFTIYAKSAEDTQRALELLSSQECYQISQTPCEKETLIKNKLY